MRSFLKGDTDWQSIGVAAAKDPNLSIYGGMFFAMVSSGSRPTERFHPHPQHPEWTVWKPEQIWGGTAAAIGEAVAKLGDPRYIRAVAVTGMGMDGLPVDAEGRWLYPFISWHDPRDRAAIPMVAGTHRGGQGLFHRRQSAVDDQLGTAASSGWPRTSRRSCGGPTSGC